MARPRLNSIIEKTDTMKTKIILSLLSVLAIYYGLFSVVAQDSTIKAMPVYSYAGIPSNGTNEVDTLTIQSLTSGGSFTLGITGSRSTPAIVWSSSTGTIIANVSNALKGLNSVGTDGVNVAAGTLASGTGTILIEFIGKNAKRDFPLLTIASNALTGGAAPTVTTGTAGVEATFRTALTGQLLIDTVTPDLYINDSVSPVNGPIWTKVSP